MVNSLSSGVLNYGFLENHGLENDLRRQLKDTRIVHRLRPAEGRRWYGGVRQGPEEASAEGVPRGQHAADVRAIRYIEQFCNQLKTHAFAFERNVLAQAEVYGNEFRATNRIPAGPRHAIIEIIAVVSGIACSAFIERAPRLGLRDQPEMPISQHTLEHRIRDGVGVIDVPDS